MDANTAWQYMVGVMAGLYQDDAYSTEMIGRQMAENNGPITGGMVHVMDAEPLDDNDD